MRLPTTPFLAPKDQAMQELGMDNQNPILGSRAIPGLADQGYPLVDLRSPLTPILAPDPSLHRGVLDPYDPRPWNEDSFAVTNRATTTIAATSRNPDPNAIYIVTSKSESLDQLESGLTKAGANTIQLDEGSTLTDLVAQIKVLTPTGGFSAIHLLGHGSEGQFFVGKETLTSRNLWRHKAELKELGTLLTENGDLLVYGCETGKGTAGQRLIDGLAKYTRADVAASDDRTYSSLSSHRNDWELEVQSGKIEAESDILTGLSWGGSLGDEPVDTYWPAKYENKVLFIDASNSHEVISVKAIKVIHSGETTLAITGFGETILLHQTTGVDKIVITGEPQKGLRIGDIDLDTDKADNLYPNAYKLDISLKNSYHANLVHLEEKPIEVEHDYKIAIFGKINTYGGDITIGNEGGDTTMENRANITFEGSSIDTRGDQANEIGDLKIESHLSALAAPLAFWFPKSSSSININSSKIDVRSFSIETKTEIDPYLNYKLVDGTFGTFVDKFELDSLLDAGLYGLQGMILPAVVKVGAVNSSVSIKDSQINAKDSISLEQVAKISLESKSSETNSKLQRYLRMRIGHLTS